MPRTIAIGMQDFESILANNCFYIDKTDFIRCWWESMDSVTLITRPRRFGKTLTMNMVERFFSLQYKGQGELFSGLRIWKDKKYRALQGAFPVLSLSFANVKKETCADTKKRIGQIFSDLYMEHAFLMESGLLTEPEVEYFHLVCQNAPEVDMALALYRLCGFMQRYYKKKVIILLDEYDTPLQEAYLRGYWDEILVFIRDLFNSTFKTNPHLDRAILTGITRISKESIFSDLNNLAVVTSTSNQYATCFGFTQTEVSNALCEFGLSEWEEEVKDWYDGFTFGSQTDIYNPWSLLNFLREKQFATYWANTSSNSLVGRLIREGSPDIKVIMEDLLNGGTFCASFDEQLVFNQLDYNEYAIWSLLLASGYLKVKEHSLDVASGREKYVLQLTNKEVKIMFQNMIADWFRCNVSAYNGFIKALLSGDKPAMNHYMNKVALATFSSFDAGIKPSEASEPERFYHGFVLGLMVELSDRYVITSNRESGFGRYDVVLKPKNLPDRDEKDFYAIIMEFKVHDAESEKTLQETAAAALRQIKEKCYAAALEAEGIPAGRIHSYGFAFCGKKVWIG